MLNRVLNTPLIQHQSKPKKQYFVYSFVLSNRCSENFAKFTREHMPRSLFFSKVSGLRPSTLLKKRLRRRCFSMNFEKFLRTRFFYRTPPVAASEALSLLLALSKFSLFIYSWSWVSIYLSRQLYLKQEFRIIINVSCITCYAQLVIQP